MSLVANRYARALLKLSEGDLAKAKDRREILVGVSELFALKDSGRVLRSPVMPQDLKKSLLTYALGKATSDSLLQRFVETVVEAGRVAMFPEIIASYSRAIDELEGVAVADVTTVVPLEQADQVKVADVLGKLLGRTVQVKTHVDKSILGGLVARIGNYRVDLSLKTKLDGMASSAVQDIYVKGRP